MMVLSQVQQYGYYFMYDHYGREDQGITVIQQAIKNYLLSIGKEMAVICIEGRPTMLDQQHARNKTRIK